MPLWEAIAHRLMPTVYMSIHQIDKGMRLQQGAEAEQLAHWGVPLLIDTVSSTTFLTFSDPLCCLSEFVILSTRRAQLAALLN